MQSNARRTQTIIVPLIFFGLSLYLAVSTHRFVGRARTATGIVTWVGRKTGMTVEITTDDGSTGKVHVGWPMLVPHGRFSVGQTVSILYEPSMLSSSNPVDVFLSPARVNAWWHLWGPCVVSLALGLIFLAVRLLRPTGP